MPEAPWLNAMAVIAIGMFIGHWVIAPAISTPTPERDPLRSAAVDRKAIDEAAARPDPSPYRTPTPTFDTSGAPGYAAAAKQKAQESLGWRDDGASTAMVEPEGFRELPIENPAPHRPHIRVLDRHTGVRY